MEVSGEGDPTYTKMVCHQLAFSRADRITAGDISEAIWHVHKTESGLVMARILSGIKGDDRRVLRHLASAAGFIKMYENETLKRLGLSSTEMCRILDRLVDEGLVDETQGHYYTLREKLYRDWTLYQRDLGYGASRGGG